MYKKLRDLRLDKKYTMNDMSKKLGISKSFYSQIEYGNRTLTYKMAYKIAKIFNKKPDYIFYDDISKDK